MDCVGAVGGAMGALGYYNGGMAAFGYDVALDAADELIEPRNLARFVANL